MSESNQPLTEFDRQCIQAFQTWHMMGRPADTKPVADNIGIARHTFSNRLLKYFIRDLGQAMPLPILPGHEIKSHTQQFNAEGELTSQVVKTGAAKSDEQFEVPAGHRVKGVSALVDANGNVVQQWQKTVEGERSDKVIAEAAKRAAESYAGPAVPITLDPYSQSHLDRDLVNVHLLPDLHIGLHSSAANAEMDWNLEKASETYRRLFRLLIERSAPAGTGVILGGGDLLHADDPMRATRGSGNRLDVADPYDVILAEAENLMVHHVELALQKYERVVVRILKGNHDPDSAVAIAHYLAAWFRSEPRVEIDCDPSLFWFFEWGVTMLGATHGHETKIKDMPGIMAADRAEMWGRTKVRYAHGFHIHHNSAGAGEVGGASWQTHEAPTPRDDWHQGNPFRSRRSLPLITYHRSYGEVATTRETLI
ncbi:hypothetical protein [Shimia sp.]|uniref:hypothetical protein n=1 Tax=Shimia sp. TaxID=1954381 RepID=UPI00329A2FA7